MIRHDAPQGSPEWHMARVGLLTASNFSELLTPAKLSRSASAMKLLDRLTAEWVLGESLDDFGGTHWTERGTALEPQARAYFTATTGLAVDDCGLIYRDEERAVGGSPDGLTHEGEPLELKCPKLSTHLGYRRAGTLPSDYRLQVQGQIWLTGAARGWFMSYHPGVPEVLIEVPRDADVCAALDGHVTWFVEALSHAKAELLAEGVEPRPVVWLA